jgi:universal stress protein family protein
MQLFRYPNCQPWANTKSFQERSELKPWTGGPVKDWTTSPRSRGDRMCRHGRSGVTRWLLGSVAETVIRHSDNPVLILRPSLSDQG